MKIIDAHVHVVQYIAGFGSQGELRACGEGKAMYASGEVIQMIPQELGEFDVTPEKVLEVMDAHDVEKAVLLQGNYFGFQNEYTYQAVKKYPDRFVGAATYDPFCVNKEKILNRLFVEQNFKIVKFEVSNGSGLMSYHPPVPLDGEVMDEAFSYADQKGVTVVIDIGRPGHVCWQVDALRRSILKYPNTKFVVCHLLAPLPKDEVALVDGLRKLNLENVWFDLAALPANQRPETFPYEGARHYLKIGKDIVGTERMMFGSDLPSTLCRDNYRNLINFALDWHVLTDADKERIFYENANHVYFS